MDPLAGSQTLLPRFKSMTSKIMKKCFQFFGLAAVSEKTFAEYIETELDELDFSALLAPWAERFGKSAIIARVSDGSVPIEMQPVSTLGHDTFSSIAATAGSSPSRRTAVAYSSRAVAMPAARCHRRKSSILLIPALVSRPRPISSTSLIVLL